MRAEELRIGNFVLELGKPGVVGKRTFENWDTFNLEDHLHPIPLTEEWLTKAGFRNNMGIPNIWFHTETGFAVLVNFLGHAVTDKFEFVTFVHELQNAFYFFLKKELEFK